MWRLGNVQSALAHVMVFFAHTCCSGHKPEGSYHHHSYKREIHETMSVPVTIWKEDWQQLSVAFLELSRRWKCCICFPKEADINGSSYMFCLGLPCLQCVGPFYWDHTSFYFPLTLYVWPPSNTVLKRPNPSGPMIYFYKIPMASTYYQVILWCGECLPGQHTPYNLRAVLFM